MLIPFVLVIILLVGAAVAVSCWHKSTPTFSRSRQLQPSLDLSALRTPSDMKTAPLTYTPPHCPIVLIHLGEELPNHVFDCIDQLRVMGAPTVHFIVDSVSTFQRLSYTPGVVAVMYPRNEQLLARIEQAHQEGVFIFSLERFFALEWFMQREKVDSVFHLEHDNLIYRPLGVLCSMVAQQAGSKIAAPRDMHNRCIASVFYVGSLPALHAFCEFIQEQKFSKFDMFVLSDFQLKHPEWCSTLPVVPQGFRSRDPGAKGLNLSEPVMECLFDAAALGQWVGGIDVIHADKDTRGFVNSDVVEYSGNELPVEWILTTDGKRVPMVLYNNRHYPLANLHMHCKQLHLYLSCTSMDAQDVIQGVKFRSLAYHQLTTEAEIDAWNPDDQNGRSTFYLHTHLVDYFTLHLWPRLRPSPLRYVLITHNSDGCVTADHLPLLNDSSLRKWFAQNCQVSHPKLVPLPIGIANPEHGHGDVGILQQNMSRRHAQKNQLYVNFKVSHEVRTRLLDHWTVKPQADVILESRPSPSFDEYLQACQSYRYVAAPRGNGPDCHRLWEAFYLDALPVTYDTAFGTIPCIPKHYLPFVDSDKPDWTPLDDAKRYLCQRRGLGRIHGRMTYWKYLIETVMSITPTVDAVVYGSSVLLQECLQSVRQYVLDVKEIFYVGDVDPQLSGVTFVQWSADWAPDRIESLSSQVLMVNANTVITAPMRVLDPTGRILWPKQSGGNAKLVEQISTWLKGKTIPNQYLGGYPQPMPVVVSDFRRFRETLDPSVSVGLTALTEMYFIHTLSSPPTNQRPVFRHLFSKTTSDVAVIRRELSEGMYRLLVLESS